MEIRDATAEDVPAIVRLLASDQLGQHREQVDGPLDDAYRRAFAAIDADPGNWGLTGRALGAGSRGACPVERGLSCGFRGCIHRSRDLSPDCPRALDRPCGARTVP